jgi:hypothetical protein
MRILSLVTFILVLIGAGFAQVKPPVKAEVYTVKKLKKTMSIDANWDKKQWKKIKAIDITNYMGPLPKFRPKAQAKMMYDKDNIYVIFRVEDQFVQSIKRELNGPVHLDACVEFFFSPDTQFPQKYINLETNAGGTPHFAFHEGANTRGVNFAVEDLEKITIASSLPKVVSAEITEPVTWTLEYKVPIAILKKYTTITQPAPGVVWKGNFYKTATTTSNPHWITWSVVDLPKPSFHQPTFFGTLNFK